MLCPHRMPLAVDLFQLNQSFEKKKQQSIDKAKCLSNHEWTKLKKYSDFFFFSRKQNNSLSNWWATSVSGILGSVFQIRIAASFYTECLQNHFMLRFH